MLLMVQLRKGYHLFSFRFGAKQATCRFNSLRPSDACMCQQTKHHCFRQWLLDWLAPYDCQSQCWNSGNWTIWQTSVKSYIQWNAFENAVGKMVAILSRPQCIIERCCSLLTHTYITASHWADMICISSKFRHTQQHKMWCRKGIQAISLWSNLSDMMQSP